MSFDTLSDFTIDILLSICLSDLWLTAFSFIVKGDMQVESGRWALSLSSVVIEKLIPL